MIYGKITSITYRIQPTDGPLDLSYRDRPGRFGREVVEVASLSPIFARAKDQIKVLKRWFALPDLRPDVPGGSAMLRAPREPK